MKIAVLHRYPLSIVESTNPSLPVFLTKLLERGHQVFLITYKGNGSFKFKGRIRFENIGISYRRQNAIESLFKSLLFVVLAPLKVRSLNKRENFDLIYCDDSFPLYELLVKILTGSKVLIRRGDLMCAYLIDKFGFAGKLLFKMAFSIEKYIWKRADGISVITEAFRQYLVKEGVEENKIFVIEDSIDFKKFELKIPDEAIRIKYGIKEEFIVMHHGVLMKMKGIDTLIRAVPLVVSQHTNIKFIIVGEGEDLGRLKQMAMELKLEKYVIFTGWVEYDDIQSYLSICDVGIPMRKNTLANNQIITTALLQYWASGKPVIAPELAAMSEVVKEDLNGFLFSPDDPESLAAKILKAVQNRNALGQMGKNGRELARKKYNSDTIAEKMCRLVDYAFQNRG